MKLPEFDNVAFVLNAIDELAGDSRFLEIRKRRHVHRTLTRIDKVTEESRKETRKAIDALMKSVEDVAKDAKKDLEQKKAELRKDLEKNNANRAAIETQLDIYLRDLQKQIDAKVQQKQQEVKQNVERIQTNENLKIRHVQDEYKVAAVVLPPLPLFLVAIGVFVVRRWKEREGVSRSRLRS